MFPHFHFMHGPVFFCFLCHICSFLRRTFHNKVIQSISLARLTKNSLWLHLTTMWLPTLSHILTNHTTSTNTPGYVQKKKNRVVFMPDSMCDYLQLSISTQLLCKATGISTIRPVICIFQVLFALTSGRILYWEKIFRSHSMNGKEFKCKIKK